MPPRRQIVMTCLAGLIILVGLGLWATMGDRLGTVAGAHLSPTPIVTSDLSGNRQGMDVRLLDEAEFASLRVQPLDIKAVGRMERSKPRLTDGSSVPGSSSFRHQWPGVYFEAQFSGTALVIAFDDAINRFRVSFPGSFETDIIITRPERAEILFDGLGSGTHTVRIEKLSESLSGPADLVGVYVPEGGTALPPPPAKSRQIEFIGDSDTVGYGNLSATRDCEGDQVTLMTDTTQSFGPLVARHFDADYHLIASSGIGLIRSLDGFAPEAVMASRYERTLFDQADGAAETGWTPQLVVLALGPNDFENELGENEPWPSKDSLRSDFEAQLLTFLEGLRSRYPNAHVVLLVMEDYDNAYLTAYETVRDLVTANGDEHVRTVRIPKMQKTGCHWHPSLKDHQMIANRIIQTLDDIAELDWRTSVATD